MRGLSIRRFAAACNEAAFWVIKTPMHPIMRTIVLLLLACGAASSFGQAVQPGPQVANFTSTVDGTSQVYGLYVPKGFDAKKRYPLVIMLHGASSNERLALRRVFGKGNAPGESDAKASSYFPEWKDIDYIVASPFSRGTMGYQGIPEQDIYDVLAEVEKRFGIDKDRVYLTGLSMGGGGTLWAGLSRPDIWAAIAPCCPASPAGTIELAPNALNFPVHIAQGGADPTVSPVKTREFVRRLQWVGTKVEYVEYPGVGHNCWDNAYQEEAILKWFGQFRRNPFPDRVRFVSAHYKYGGAYWVQFDKITPGTLAGIDAKFTGRNRIEIATSELDGFTLRLAGHPKFNANRAVELAVDGKTLKMAGGETISLSKQKDGWVAAKYEAPALAKRAGCEGPLSDALDGRHVYVYGTADNPSPEELQKRKEQAEFASHWYTGGDPWGHAKTMPLRAVADRDVSQDDLDTCNLVLFGTKENNSIIAKYSDRLPLALKADAKDYGLVYVFPLGKHYALVNSGLPWWTVPQGARLPGAGWIGPIGVLRSSEMDYVLFRDSWNDVVADGRFGQNWNLLTNAARQARAGGVVSINPNASAAPDRSGP